MSKLACTLWLTGLSAAGKTTLAFALAEAFDANGLPNQVLDGDLVRQQLCRDLGFSREDRRENIRRVADLCRQLNDFGTLSIASLISPYREDRNLARQMVGPTRFIEIYLSTSLAVCETRDPKGLYRRARCGVIPGFTGISAPYEVPRSPDLTFDTAVQSLEECVALTVCLIAARAAAWK